MLTWWWHQLIKHSYRILTRRYISAIFVYNLSGLCTSIDLIKENSFMLRKTRSRHYPAETMTDTDYADDLELLTNTLALAKSLRHSLEPAAKDVHFYVNTDKTEFTYFKREEAISIQSGKPLKLVVKFTYLGCNISSTEIDVNIYLTKVWNAINWLSDPWKSNLSDKIKWDFV